MKSPTIIVRIFAALILLSQVTLAQWAGNVANQTPLDARRIPKYVTPLPYFGGARVDGTKQLTVTMMKSTQQVLPAFDAKGKPTNWGPTTVWAYKINDGTKNYGPLWPAYTIEAQRGTPTTVTYVNDLDNYQDVLLTVDQTLHWAEPAGAPVADPYTDEVPGVVHLHGGEVPPHFDGGPDSWFTKAGTHGHAWATNEYTYPNEQEAGTLWFHDHALGVTRLNVYAGLAGYYFLRDATTLDTGIPAADGLPAGQYEVELAIQDRMFDTNAQLYFPAVGINPEHPYWVPEFVGDVITVNGVTWPYMNVEPRRYRFRFLDGSNARFYELFLVNQATNAMGPVLWQIGTDGGLLDKPVAIDPKAAANNRLLLGPGERADVIIDFSGFAGATLLMKNTGKTPYPAGAAPSGATVGQIMQFRVSKPAKLPVDGTYDPSKGGSLRSTPLVALTNFALANAPNLVPDKTRKLTLNEVMGMGGPLEVLVNNTKWMGAPHGEAPRPDFTPDATGHNYLSELPVEGETEMWEIINLTADAHPIHLHLVQFQLVSRQKFDVTGYNAVYAAAFPGGGMNMMVNPPVAYPPGVYMPGYGPPLDYNTNLPQGTPGPTNNQMLGGNPDWRPFAKGPARPAQPNEAGWKDTFIMYPGEVTRVIVRFAPTDKPLTSNYADLFFPFDPNGGHGYVWHCHIIDHEDNEMMRPYAVTPNPNNLKAMGKATVAERVTESNPQTFSLDQNYPNPFNPSTEIRFSIPENSHVRLVVYNSLGQEVSTLLDQTAPAGQHTVKMDASRLASGVYFYQIQTGSYTALKKMVLLK